MEKTLRRALDSLVVQTYRNFEVIMIDDGSIDSSAAICDEYAETYPNFRVCHKSNGGLSSARNKGIELARSEWVTFCDSDDYVFPNWLENYRLSEENDYDLIAQGMKTDKPFFNSDELCEQSGFEFVGGPIDYLEKARKFELVGYTVIKAYRRKIIQDNDLKFNVKLWFREDEAFLLEYLLYCKKIKSSNEIGYFYFTPDWNRKYNSSFDDKIFLEEYKFNILSKYEQSAYGIQIAVDTRNALNKYLTEAFFETKDLKYVKKLHYYYQKYPDFAPLLKFTRKLIQVDSSGLMSGIALYTHMAIRKMLHVGEAKEL